MLIRAIPQLRPMVWGNDEINSLYGEQGALISGPVGEVWLLSDHPLYKTTLETGPSLAELGRALYGDAYPRFPLLVKLVSTKQWLSVQVHPDDEHAKNLESEPWGKSEAWYFVNDGEFAICEDCDSLKNLLDEGRLDEVSNIMKFVKVKSGTIVNLPAGTVHALGANSTVIEIQQSSDLTYRIYDWGRPRETHIAKASQVWKNVSLSELVFENASTLQTPYFTMNVVEKEELEQVLGKSRFAIVIPARLERGLSALLHIGDEKLLNDLQIGPIAIENQQSSLSGLLEGVDRFVVATAPFAT